MTLEQDDVDVGVFGLDGAFPHPGWVVLDAARQHGFTGELTFETIPTVKVYLDGGMIYLAERVTDPPLGTRLVDAGALNAAQLEHGSMLLGDVAHLGRLFERVPSVNRQTVMVMTEMMTEECVGWLAGQLIRAVDVAPYRHHPAGVQRWLHPSPGDRLEPGDPLPPPPADATPVKLVAPQPLFSPPGSFDDGLITWDQPSWLDEPLAAPSPIDLSDESSDAPDAEHPPSATPADEPPVLPVRIPNASAADQAVAADWTEVVADATDVPDVPAVSPTAATPPNVESALDDVPEATSTPDPTPAPVDRPSLSIESVLDALMASPPSASPVTALHDVAEPVAEAPRPTGLPTDQPDPAATSVTDDWVDRLESAGPPEPGFRHQPSTERVPPSQPVTADRFEVIWPSGEVDDQFGSTDGATVTGGDRDLDGAGPSAPVAPGSEPAGDPVASTETLEPAEAAPDSFVPASDELTLDDDEVTDEVVLAVRRAVASIETSSLDARRRLVATERDDDPSRGVGRPSERPVRSLRPVSETSDALTPGATSARRVPTRSVFDDDVVMVPAEPQASADDDVPEPVLPVLPPATHAPVAEQHEQRVGALRRLIGSLRRR